MATPELVGELLRTTNYALTVFDPRAIRALEVTERNGRPYVGCLATSRLRPAKPEEIVRQLFLWQLIHEYGYPPERIAIEKPVQFGSAVHEKAADIVVSDR